MNNPLISNYFENYKALIGDIFKELHQLTTDIKNEKLSKTVDEIRSRLDEPFLFVIVGEVKVGKSSFINALLKTGKEVCKVAPDPCTDTIQQIVYGEEEGVIEISQYYKKIIQPVEILKKIAIVDTPGTNTIAEHHQEITERFVPINDLIIFVFEAKNPYRQSAWDFLDFVSKEWRKKVIFVLQQSDLMEPQDLEINKNGVYQQAIKKGIDNPQVFCVSAKKENNDEPDSGFKEIKEYITNSITGGNNATLKMKSLLNTSKNIIDNLKQGIDLRNKQLDADNVFRNRISLLMNNADIKIQKQVDDIVKEMLETYDKISGNIQYDFEAGLGFTTLLKKSFFSIFNQEESLKNWLSSITLRFEQELRPALEDKIKNGVLNIAESIKQMAEIIDIEIRKNEAVLKQSHQVFGDIANKRHERLEKLHTHFNEMISSTEAFINNELFRKSSNLMPNITTGSIIAVIGGILMGVTHTMVFDITGGILTTLGLSLAGIYTAVKKGEVIEEFKTEITVGRQKLKEQVEEKLKTYIKEIKTKIDNNFLEFDTFVNEEHNNLNNLNTNFNLVYEKFNKLNNELGIQ